MNDSVNLFYAVGCLVMVASALASRRLPVSTLIRGFLAWGAIFAVAWVAIANRDRIEGAVTAVADQLGLSEQQVVGDTVRIKMNPDGHFWARVTINGVSKTMLVDSGATYTAISEATARSAGITVDESDFPMELSTANGVVAARRAVAERIGVGSLETRDLNVVVSSSFGDTDVLGMNFLSRLKSWRVEGRTLVLEPDKDRSSSTSDTSE